MLNILIKYFFIYICYAYIYKYLINNHNKKHFQMLFSIIFSLILSFTTIIIKKFFPSYINIAPIIILWIMRSITSFQPKISFVTTMLAFVLVMDFLFFLALLLFLFFPLYVPPSLYPCQITLLFSLVL